MADRSTIRTRVNKNVGNANMPALRFSNTQVNNSIQKGYNWLVSLTGTVQTSVSLPFPSDTPYINLRQQLSDYFAPLGIYNLKTNKWLEPVTSNYLDEIRWDWERWVGEPTDCFTIIDFNRVGIFPYQTVGSGNFILWYLAIPATLGDATVLEMPDSYADAVEDYGSADLLELDREYGKALEYYRQFYDKVPALQKEINNVAYADKNLVLEPYLPLGRYGG